VDAAAVLLTGLSRALAALPPSPAPVGAQDELNKLLEEVQLLRQELARLGARLGCVPCERRTALLRPGTGTTDLQAVMQEVESKLERHQEHMERKLLELMQAQVPAPLPQISDRDGL
jgi:hypothetical protein